MLKTIFKGLAIIVGIIVLFVVSAFITLSIFNSPTYA